MTEPLTQLASNPRGEPIVSVLVKRTYDVLTGGRLRLADEQLPLHTLDEEPSEPNTFDPSWRAELDVAPFKPLTDIVVFGSAYGEGGQCSRTLASVGLVGTRIAKQVAVFGDRRCLGRGSGPPRISAPEPFERIPLTYEHAYGGVDLTVADPRQPDDLGTLLSIMTSVPGAYPRNPAGTGFVVNAEAGVDGLRLPNLEDPTDLLAPDRIVVGDPRRWHGQPLPQGLGWVDLGWFPRSVWGGALPVYEPPEQIAEVERGWLPADFVTRIKNAALEDLLDCRLFNGASLGLSVPSVSRGATFELQGLHPSGTLRWPMPHESPWVSVSVAGMTVEMDCVVHTVALLVEEHKLYTVWRANGPLPHSFVPPRPTPEQPDPDPVEHVAVEIAWR